MTSPIDREYLLLIDISSHLHAHFHAQARMTRASDGLPVGALSGICWSLMKHLIFKEMTSIDALPSYAAVIMDSRGRNFRHDLYEDYKAHRSPYDPDLEAQIPWIPKICEAFRVPCIKMAGWEADDIVATYARMGEESGLQVVIATRDKDLAQCVTDNVFLYNAKEDKDPERYDNAEAIKDVKSVREKFGVWPWQMVDLQAIIGDSVDGVPGIPKFGLKTAARLLDQFGTLDQMLDSADWGDDDFEKPKEAEAIRLHEEQVRLSRLLVTLERNVPVKETISDLRLQEPSRGALRDLFNDLALPQLIRRLDRW